MLDLINRVHIAMMTRLKLEREEGQAMVEYALILSMVSVGAIGILSALGTSVSNIFNSINNKL